jgi:hypothetical protein
MYPNLEIGDAGISFILSRCKIFSIAKSSVCLKNREIATEWFKFHEEKARLRVTCADCNLRRPKKRAKKN